MYPVMTLTPIASFLPSLYEVCNFDGLGEYLFHDVRYDDQGNKKAHSLNDERFLESSIMLSGKNFGCGSSREHAPQSLYRAGFRAIVAGNFCGDFSLETQLIWESPAYPWMLKIELNLLNGSSQMLALRSLWMLTYSRLGRRS